MARGETKHPLSIVVSAVDRATRPMRRIQQVIDRTTRPARRLRGALKLAYADTGLPKVLDAFRAMGSSVLRVGRALAGIVTKLGLIAGAAGAAAFALVKSFADAGDNVAKTALRLGIGIEKLQEWRFAAESAGVSAQTFDMAMQRVGRRVAEAVAGMGEARPALAALGVSATDASGRVRTLESLLPELADKLSAVESSSTRNALAMKLFDSEGVALVQMLKDGSAGLDEMGRQARETGRIIGPEGVARSEAFKDALLRLHSSMLGVRRVIAEEILPAFTEFFGRLSSWLIEHRQTVSDFTSEFMAELPGRIAMLQERLGALWQSVKPVIDRFREFADWLRENNRWVGVLAIGLGALALILAIPMLAALALVTKAVIALGAALLLTPVGLVITGIGILVAGLIWLGDNWDWLGEKVDQVVGWIIDRLRSLKDWALGVFEDIGGFIAGLFGSGGDVDQAADRVAEARERAVGDALDGGSFDINRTTVADIVGDGSARGGSDERSVVLVQFEDVPEGARVQQDRRGGSNVDLEVGYAMAEFGR
ncbi:MAG: hypothetical protein AAGB93_00590 [Planctomycetota bacterium]